MSLRICFLAMICISVVSVIKHTCPDFLPYVRIASIVVVGVFALSIISPIVTYIDSLFSGASLGESGKSILKALGIALLVQICADVCRDCGENSAALGVELIGKLEIIILCLPMIKSIISTALEVLSW